jgi:hypothetical protein
MSLLDCAALLKESKISKTKMLAEAFVKHAIPLIDATRLQEAFVQQIKISLKPELPIFAYKTTEITVNGSTIADDSLCGQTVASMAYEFCDKLPCGTPIGKAISGWSACELLGMVLGPNIHVKTRFKCRNEDHPQWLGYTADIVASFQEKPVKRSATGLAWWPDTFLKELIAPTGGRPFQQLERSSESLLNALLTASALPQERSGSEGVVWTRGADGMMRCPGGGMNLQDPRTNMLWQTRLDIAPPPPFERAGATAEDYPAMSGLARRLFSIPCSTASYIYTPSPADAMGPPPPLERVGATAGDQDESAIEYAESDEDTNAYLERHAEDRKCTFCGLMESDCGGDHVDEMRDIIRESGGW